MNKQQNMQLGDTSIDSFLSLGKIKAHEHPCPIKASGRNIAWPQIILYLVCDYSFFGFLSLETGVSWGFVFSSSHDGTSNIAQGS